MSTTYTIQYLTTSAAAIVLKEDKLAIVVESTTARTLVLTDASKYIRCTNAAAVSITMPPQASVAWISPTRLVIEKSGTGDVTLIAGSGVTLNSPNGLVLTIQFSKIELIKTATNIWTCITLPEAAEMAAATEFIELDAAEYAIDPLWVYTGNDDVLTVVRNSHTATFFLLAPGGYTWSTGVTEVLLPAGASMTFIKRPIGTSAVMEILADIVPQVQQFEPETVAELQLLNNIPDGKVVSLSGYYAKGDSGGQQLVYHETGRAANSITDNQILEFFGLGGDDYFAAVDRTITAKSAGLKGDGATNDTTRLSAAIALSNALGQTIKFEKGTYLINTVSGLNCQLEHGAILKATNGSTVTLQYVADDFQNCFDVSTTGIFTTVNTRYVTPEHFGATGTTDQLSFRRAIECAMRSECGCVSNGDISLSDLVSGIGISGNLELSGRGTITGPSITQYLFNVGQTSGASVKITGLNFSTFESVISFEGNYVAASDTTIGLSDTFSAATTDICTYTSTVNTPSRITTGTQVRVKTTTTLPAGLSALTYYYVIRLSDTTFKLATSYANAIAETPVPVDITSTGTGTHTILWFLPYSFELGNCSADNLGIGMVASTAYWDSRYVRVYENFTSNTGKTLATLTAYAFHLPLRNCPTTIVRDNRIERVGSLSNTGAAAGIVLDMSVATDSAQSVTVTNNQVEGVYSGITSGGTDQVGGIYVLNAQGIISQNHVDTVQAPNHNSNPDGIYLKCSKSVVAINEIIDVDSREGCLLLKGELTGDASSEKTLVIGNNISFRTTPTYGIGIGLDAPNITCVENILNGCFVGVSCVFDGTVVENNTFLNCKSTGIYTTMQGTSLRSYFRGNRFIGTGTSGTNSWGIQYNMGASSGYTASLIEIENNSFTKFAGSGTNIAVQIFNGAGGLIDNLIMKHNTVTDCTAVLAISVAAAEVVNSTEFSNNTMHDISGTVFSNGATNTITPLLRNNTLNGAMWAGNDSIALTGSSLTVTGDVTCANLITSGAGVTNKITDSGGSADQKHWYWQHGGAIGDGKLRLRAVNDAISSGINVLEVTRTGIASIVVDIPGTITTGPLTSTGAIAATGVTASGAVVGTASVSAGANIASTFQTLLENGRLETRYGGETYPRVRIHGNGRIEFGNDGTYEPAVIGCAFGLNAAYEAYIACSNGSAFVNIILVDATGLSLTGKLTTTGAIELGHASDTTIARVSAGVISVEGVNVILSTIPDSQNIVLGSSNGTKIATATSQKLGFWDATPVVQPASADQAVVTLGNTNGEISALTFSATVLQAEAEALRDKSEELADDVRALSTLLHSIRTALVNSGLIKGAA